MYVYSLTIILLEIEIAITQTKYSLQIFVVEAINVKFINSCSEDST